ncbi:MAG: hypothetical protein WB723_08125 [Candidatus Acidiferrales bacterium]
MNKSLPFRIVALSLSFASLLAAQSEQRDRECLRLIQTIPMPNVRGRLDHMDVDVEGKRLFVSGLENGSLEIVNLQEGKWSRSVRGFKKPQGIAYLAMLNKLFVASGDDGMLRVFRGDTLALVDSIHLDLGPNRVVYDPDAKHLYVGYGGKDAGKDFGEVGIVDPQSDKKIGDIQVAGHPSELLLNHAGNLLFILVSGANEIQVADTKTRQLVFTWPVSSQRPGSAALDEATGRLLIGTHTPPEMVVMNSQSGREVAALPTVDGMDGVYFDANLKRIYISGGRGTDVGFVYVYQQLNADHYTQIRKIPTRAGAGTSFWCPKLHRYYVAAPSNASEDAAVLVYEPQP